MMHRKPQRGFTLLIAIILSSVVLTVGLSLLDVAYKQVVLSSTAKQSQVAFYNADSALECALYYDQKFNLFDYTSGSASLPSTLKCSSAAVTNYTSTKDATKRVTVFSALPCTGGGGAYATVTIYKYPGGATTLYSNGYNSCSPTDPARIERGLKATYGDPNYVPVAPPPPPPPSNARAFSISPAVSGKSYWNLDTDGVLALNTAGTWTITSTSTFNAPVKAWGAGGGNGSSCCGTQGAGGYAGGTVSFGSGTYTVSVGSAGDSGHAPGGGTSSGGNSNDGPGGGYSGIKSGSTAVLIAGGGGGNGWGGNGGAGGGTSGQDATYYSNPGTEGRGGTSSSGGGAGGGGGTAGSAYQGGNGGGSYSGGAGGGGYFGGGGGGYVGGGGAGGGGGGSSYFNSSFVASGVLTGGNYTTPGNSGDADRGTGGNPLTSGRVKIGP